LALSLKPWVVTLGLVTLLLGACATEPFPEPPPVPVNLGGFDAEIAREIRKEVATGHRPTAHDVLRETPLICA
jgi:hypothetical protein